MRNLALISAILLILSSIFLGCIQPPAVAPTPTPTPENTRVVMTSGPTPSPARTPVVYKSFMDDGYGFFKVRIVDLTQEAQYVNNTLTINTGDEVIWVNDASERLTIVSEEGLWDMNNTRARLLYQTSEFNFTFTQPGTYGFYIREYPRLPHQKITVNP
ncbi:MAG: hypothetical protein OIN88_06035 [Candidatus Methanoperedens sp.]|nr:hypothetical protein [Candidatus Methanoperedens sp.]